MINTEKLDELARRLAESMPAGLREFQADIEKNLKASLQGTFQRMDLVTREEFEVQSALLARSRERLRALEDRIAALEARLEAE
jgi:BMFP domain-containing protein YqiC